MTLRIFFFVLFPLLFASCRSTPPTTLPRGHASTFSKGGEFKIGEGDILEVVSNVPKEPATVVTVNIDGNIYLPLVGEVKARNVSLADLAKTISQKYEPYIKNPKFAVNVREMRSYKVYVFGEAKQNGEYQFTSRTSLLGALAKAGGLTDYASGRITVFRKSEEGQLRFDFKLEDIFREEASGEPLYVERADVIVLY